MAILTPDKTTTLGGVNVKEYLLTRHNPNHIDMPSVSTAGKIIGVTVHNTDWITVARGTTPAEQYTRATVNGNMKDVRVHYYVDNTCAWQNLPHSLSGWHAADGSGNGNRRTIAIECIMSSSYNSTDKKSEDNAAKLAAALLKQYGLDINHLYTHTHWLNVRDGKRGTVDQLNTMHNSYKMCPAYILPQSKGASLSEWHFCRKAIQRAAVQSPKERERYEESARRICFSGERQEGMQGRVFCFRFQWEGGVYQQQLREVCERPGGAHRQQCTAVRQRNYYHTCFTADRRNVLHLRRRTVQAGTVSCYYYGGFLR